ncbi:MAG: toll/interleukin-1 receptor domain-containing protein [Chloroflexota bacterium]
MKHIFISFSQRDSRYMTTMRENLIRIGYKPWIDPKPRPGQDWRFEIDDAIRSADAVLVIVSPSAAESVYVTYEWSLAIGLDVPVIPVIFSKAKMHPRLNMLEQITGITGTTKPMASDHSYVTYTDSAA